jgi:hypothetical protein
VAIHIEDLSLEELKRIISANLNNRNGWELESSQDFLREFFRRDHRMRRLILRDLERDFRRARAQEENRRRGRAAARQRAEAKLRVLEQACQRKPAAKAKPARRARPAARATSAN